MLDTTKEEKAFSAKVDFLDDGNESLPSEIQGNTSLADTALVNNPLQPGYTVDEQGILNNYAVEPPISLAKYPSTQQQQRYVFQGIAAILFVSLILLIVFNIN